MALWLWLWLHDVKQMARPFIFLSTVSIISARILTAQQSWCFLYSHLLLYFLIRLFCCVVYKYLTVKERLTSTCLLLHTTGKQNRLVGFWYSGSDAADVRFVSGCQSLHLFSTLFRHFVFLYFFFCFFTFLGSSGWAAPCVWFTDRTRRKRKIPFPFAMYIIFQFGFVCVCAVCSLCESLCCCCYFIIFRCISPLFSSFFLSLE